MIQLRSGIFDFFPIYYAPVVDTIVAGDTYCGALVTRLSKGASFIEAMEFASRASAITIQRRGAQQCIPYKDEVPKD